MTEQFYPFKFKAAQAGPSAVAILAIVMVPLLIMRAPLPAFVLVTALLFVFCLPMIWFAPRGVILSADGIRIVKRPARRPVAFPASQIVSLQRIGRRDMRGTIRSWGVGLPGAAWGHFSNKHLGAFRAYVTDLDSLLLIRTVSEGPVVISPDKPDDFIAQAESFGLTPSRTENA